MGQNFTIHGSLYSAGPGNFPGDENKRILANLTIRTEGTK